MKTRVWAIACLMTLMGSVCLAGKRVVFIGDSITDGGWGRSGGSAKASSERNHGDLNHLMGHSYVIFCATDYLSRNPEADYVFFNIAVR